MSMSGPATNFAASEDDMIRAERWKDKQQTGADGRIEPLRPCDHLGSRTSSCASPTP
jgi:hypothetical protein